MTLPLHPYWWANPPTWISPEYGIAISTLHGWTLMRYSNRCDFWQLLGTEVSREFWVERVTEPWFNRSMCMGYTCTYPGRWAQTECRFVRPQQYILTTRCLWTNPANLIRYRASLNAFVDRTEFAVNNILWHSGSNILLLHEMVVYNNISENILAPGRSHWDGLIPSLFFR